MKLRKAANQSAFQFRQRDSNAFLPIVQCQKPPLDGLAQPAEIGAADRVTRANRHLGTSLHEHAGVSVSLKT